MAEKKEKQYVSDNAQLMAEWDCEKNTGLGFDPTKLTLGSHTKVWWKCSRNHEWYAAISARNRGTNCPFCSGNKILVGYNDLESTNPTLTKEWNFEKNAGISPKDVMPNSSKKVWWKCSKGHEWQAMIKHRNNGSGCPFCSGQKAVSGINDLQTTNPVLSQEWNFERNNGLTPRDILPYSNKKVWWRCHKGHEWQATVSNRSKGSGCPRCISEKHTSFPEYALVYYLKKCGLNVIHSFKENDYELDIYIPSKRIAIEYDGYYWHRNAVKRDLEKNSKCRKDGITLYRVREGLLSLNDSSIDYIVYRNQENLSSVIEEVLREITGMTIVVNLVVDTVDIENLRELTEKDNSILLSNPRMAAEWNYDKNGTLRPEFYAANSNKIVWWKCKKGHEWQTSIANRNYGFGCPYCAGQKVLSGYNDLKTINPILAQEWNYEKNDGLTPEDVQVSSGKKVWWRCQKGHEWEASIASRNRGTGCPYCSDRKILLGYNDLSTTSPSLAREWNYKKNGTLRPENFTHGSEKKVWWICEKGHEWQATIANRSYGFGCPYCSGRKVIVGTNDLATNSPELAREWHKFKNHELTAKDVSIGSYKKVWWICEKGHEWQAAIASRYKGAGCPFCTNHKVLKGYNDLQTLNPSLAKEWNYEKNGNLNPDNVSIGSSKKVWWKCENGHEWEAVIYNRNNGRGCPECAKQKRKKVK